MTCWMLTEKQESKLPKNTKGDFLQQILLSIKALTASEIWGNVWPYLLALLLFALLVSIHEFGHFFVAKLCGIKVNEFALGFGPKLFSFGKKETKYSLRLIPFGGFCAMEGEDEESADGRAYCNKPVYKRIAVCAAGAINNLILGFLLFVLLLCLSGAFGTTVVANFNEGATSCLEGGLEVEDKIKEIDGRKIFCHRDISYMLINSEDTVVDITVERDGEEIELKNVSFPSQEIDGKRYISLDFKVYGVKVSWGNALQVLKVAALETFSAARLVWMTLIDMIGGRYGLNEMMGPVGTISAVGEAAKANLSSLVYMMAIITVNLGVFNLIPFPALDGGRILLLAVEGVTRKKIPEKYESWIHAAGLILLLLLMLVVGANDIKRLITGRWNL